MEFRTTAENKLQNQEVIKFCIPRKEQETMLKSSSLTIRYPLLG